RPGAHTERAMRGNNLSASVSSLKSSQLSKYLDDFSVRPLSHSTSSSLKLPFQAFRPSCGASLHSRLVEYCHECV
ncbi:MAG: hypothetical protein SGPRY_010509, partial [Prymnesium sp.]